MSARSIGSTTITFGLVSIPVRLYTAVAAKSVSLNRLHKGCGGRFEQLLRCKADGKIVAREETIRGYEHARDQFVQFTDEEIAMLEQSRLDVIELAQFVPAGTVDWRSLEGCQYLGPDKGGDRAYQLLSRALEREGCVGVGRWRKPSKDTIAIVRPFDDGGLAMHQAYYADEVRSFDDVPRARDLNILPRELRLARELIQLRSTDRFDASDFKDSWRELFEEAVRKKVAKEDFAPAPETHRAPVIDLMDALEQSVQKKGGQAPASGPKKASPARPRARRAG